MIKRWVPVFRDPVSLFLLFRKGCKIAFCTESLNYRDIFFPPKEAGPRFDHMTLGVSRSLRSLALSSSSLGGTLSLLSSGLWWLRMQVGGLSTWVFRIHFRTKWSYQLYGLNTIKHTQFLLWNSEFKITAVTAAWVKFQWSSLLIWSWLSNLTFEDVIFTLGQIGLF